MSITRTTVNGPCFTLYNNVVAGSVDRLFFLSDVHFDSVYCARTILEQHLQAAKDSGGYLFFIGDFFDAMQGRFDPRRSMSELAPRYRREDYYDFVVTDAAEFLRPYAANIYLMADGNHELSVLKNANTSLLDRLVYELRRMGSPVQHGGYGGWIRYMYQQESGNPIGSVRIRYYHGSGGEAPVTRGVIQTNRQAVYLPNADVVVNGHSHNAYHVPITRERLTGKGEVRFETAHFLRTPGYKQGYGDGSSGWEVTRGGIPKPIGCYCLQILSTCKDQRFSVQLTPIPYLADPESVTIDGTEVYSGMVYDDDGENM